MKRLYILIPLVCVLTIVFWHLAPARPITYYHYLSNFETTGFDEVIWFWTYDTIRGPLHSNDYIGLKYSPHFYGPVSTSKERFIYYSPQNIYFEYEPMFNAPPVLLPRSYPQLIEMAFPIIEDDDGRLMTRIALRGEDGIDVYQYPTDEQSPEPGDEGPLSEHYLQVDQSIVYVDGESEVYGTLIGGMTIYSSGDMYLVDDILYDGALAGDGWFDEDEMEHMLGLVSEQNIIIRNNYHNGRDNGFNQYSPQETEHHSIAINAALVALNESFTFEHQNDDWEDYQGPSPDERGIIHLKGSVAQWRRGYTHRSNHQGTGYSKDFHYDTRLMEIAPPGLESDEPQGVSGNYDILNLFDGPYLLNAVTVRKLIVRAGVKVILRGNDTLHVSDTLEINGTVEQPVIIRTEDNDSPGTIRVMGNEHSRAYIYNTDMSSAVRLGFQTGNTDIEQCRISGEVSVEGNVRFVSNLFGAPVEITSYDQVLIERNVFEDGLGVGGSVENGRIYNNTFTGSRHNTGLELNHFRSIEVVNNIIAFNRKGIEQVYQDVPVLRYNCVYGNIDGDYTDCEPGEGCISEHPRFADQVRGDFRLSWDSPCIDTGDPNFPLDPDGSRADMGAFWFDHEHDVKSEPVAPSELDLQVYPNPFNHHTELHIQASIPGLVYIKVVDLQGRRVYEDVQRILIGNNRIALDGRKLGGAGVYLAQVMTFSDMRTVKLVYLP